MVYCKKCIMPDSKPDILFNEDGICNACTNYDERKNIDWGERKSELKGILEEYKGENYDCIIPVSGGKDSHYQVITILKMGYKPLCVTATTCDLSDIGRRNIENIKNLGVDYIEVTFNQVLRKRLNRLGLEIVGDISWPEHVAIFTIPVRMAVMYKVPLIVWGENSQNEYGGPASEVNNNYLTRRWLEEFGGLNGMRIQDMIDTEGLTHKDLWLLTYPKDEELKNVTGIFLGYYMPWDGYINAQIAKYYGFETYHTVVEGSCVDYENLDNYQTGIHDYFKYLKFGFGRVTDLLCMAIRRGQITREQAIEIANRLDGRYPKSYLGKPLKDILNKIGMSVEMFNELCDKFRNKKIIYEDGSLINPRC